MKYHIRPAERRDIDELVTLCSEHAAYERAPFDSGRKAVQLSFFLFQERRFCCFVAEDNAEQLLGYATCMSEFSTWDAELYLHMDCLYLRPHARNVGIGAEFMRIVAKKATELGCKQIQWQTPQWNIDAIRFYRRLGATSREKLRMYVDEHTIQQLVHNPKRDSE